MANSKYPLGMVALASASINLTSDTIKVALVSSGYTFSTAHQFYSDLTPASNVVGTPVALTGKTVSAGTAYAAFNAVSPVTFASVPVSSQVVGLAIYKDTGVAATSPLLAWIDTASGLPVTPNGGNISLVLDSGVFKIFAIG